MSPYEKISLTEVKDSAPDFGLSGMGEARFARRPLGTARIGLAHYRMNPGRRLGFGHRHDNQEEVYVVLSGSGRFKVDDEIFPVAPRDVVFCPPGTMREWEADDGGLELLAFGEHRENDTEMKPGWWTD
jgi:mannose-6-phosphate isomerase-like protein (cupin superfamily)